MPSKIKLLRGPFIRALEANDLEEAEELLCQITTQDAHALVNSPSACGSTPLFAVAWRGYTTGAELLLKSQARVNWKNVKGNTPICLAIENNHIETVKLFLSWGAECCIRIVNDIRLRTGKIISPEIDVHVFESNVVDHSTISHWFSNRKGPVEVPSLEPKAKNTRRSKEIPWYEEFVVACATGDTKGVQKLITVNPDLPRHVDASSCTGLFFAAKGGYLEIVSLLHKAGTSFDVRNSQSRTALSVALECNRFEVVKYLLVNGANTSGISIAHLAGNCDRNLDSRVKDYISYFPPTTVCFERRQPSAVDGMSLQEFIDYKEIFSFFDTNRNGYITPKTLHKRLSGNSLRYMGRTKFSNRVISEMVRGKPVDKTRGRKVDFDQFVRIFSE